MSLPRQWLLLLALLVLGAGATAWLAPRPAAMPHHEVSVVEAQKIAPVLWIDARSEIEFARGHIPGAVNLNEDNWSAQIAVVLTHWVPSQTLVVYCGSAACQASHQVAGRLRGAEYQLDPVRVLQGGWEEWRKQGGEVAR